MSDSLDEQLNELVEHYIPPAYLTNGTDNRASAKQQLHSLIVREKAKAYNQGAQDMKKKLKGDYRE